MTGKQWLVEMICTKSDFRGYSTVFFDLWDMLPASTPPSAKRRTRLFCNVNDKGFKQIRLIDREYAISCGTTTVVVWHIESNARVAWRTERVIRDVSQL